MTRVRCAACGATHAWSALAHVRELSGAEVAMLAIGWPNERRVVVRACARCGKELARVEAEDAA